MKPFFDKYIYNLKHFVVRSIYSSHLPCCKGSLPNFTSKV